MDIKFEWGGHKLDKVKKAAIKADIKKELTDNFSDLITPSTIVKLSYDKINHEIFGVVTNDKGKNIISITMPTIPQGDTVYDVL